MNESIVLYHYTSSEAAVKIKKRGAILPQKSRGHPTGKVAGVDITGEAGVICMNNMPPEQYSKELIAYNNFGRGWRDRLWKCEEVVRVEVPKGKFLVWEEKPEKDCILLDGRNIFAWLGEGGPLKLTGWPDEWRKCENRKNDEDWLDKYLTNLHHTQNGMSRKRKRSDSAEENSSTGESSSTSEQPSAKKIKLSVSCVEQQAEVTGDISLLSWNVHFKTNIYDVSKALQSVSANLVCLQEISGQRAETFINQMKPFLPYVLRGEGCLILSRYQLKEVARGKFEGHRGFLSGRLDVNEKPFIITTLHLDPNRESTRLSELEQVRKRLSVYGWSKVVAGDFNSVTRGDYTLHEWKELEDIRRENGLEPPRIEVSTKMTELGFTDCWEDFGRSGPLNTSHKGGGTHVDYIYQDETMKKMFVLKNHRHLWFGPSDHRPLLSTFGIFE